MNIVEAIEHDDLKAVREIVGHDPKAVSIGSPAEQPIHYAAWLDKTKFLDYLAECGADINATDTEGRTPLHYAVFHGNPKPAKGLIRRKASLNLVDQYGCTPLVNYLSRYDLEIDYFQPPDVSLPADAEAWADQLLRAAGKRR